mmetsp:Transcript_38054/g.109756  ORF Transcript_38054/g.109756 Transcript_38054/m.109756 type:complete len:423 (+) Transcript_38054:197-1465(+)
MAERIREVPGIDVTVAAAVEVPEHDVDQPLVATHLAGERRGEELEVRDVPVIVDVDTGESALEVARDAHVRTEVVALESLDGQLPVRASVDHGERKPLRAACLEAVGRDVGHDQQRRPLQHGLVGESGESSGELQEDVLCLLHEHAVGAPQAGVRLGGRCQEGVPQQFAGGGPLVPVQLEHGRQNLECVLRDTQRLRPPQSGTDPSSVVHLRLDLVLGLDEWHERRTGQHFEEHRTATPDVRLRPVQPVPHLRSHVLRCAADLLPVTLETATQTEVDHLQLGLGRIGFVHEVLRLYVEVAHIVTVAALQRLQNLPQRVGRLALAHAGSQLPPALRMRGLDPLQEVLALAELEDKVNVRPLIEVPHELHDIGVIQVHQGMDLSNQRFELVLLTLGLLSHLLHGAAMAELFVPRQVDFPECAAA